MSDDITDEEKAAFIKVARVLIGETNVSLVLNMSLTITPEEAIEVMQIGARQWLIDKGYCSG
jgi:hypothetical protein